MQKVQEVKSDDQLRQELDKLMQNALKIATQLQTNKTEEFKTDEVIPAKSAVNLILKSDSQNNRFDFVMKCGNEEFSAELLNTAEKQPKDINALTIYKKNVPKKSTRQKLFTTEKKNEESEKTASDSEDSDSDNSIVELEDAKNNSKVMVEPVLEKQMMEEEFDFEKLALKIKNNTQNTAPEEPKIKGEDLLKDLREVKKQKKKPKVQKEKNKDKEKTKIKRKRKSKKKNKEEIAAQNQAQLIAEIKKEIMEEIKKADITSEEKIKEIKDHLDERIKEEFVEFKTGQEDGTVKPGERHVLIKSWEIFNAFELGVDKDLNVNEPDWEGHVALPGETFLKRRGFEIEGKTYEEAIGKKGQSTFRYI